MKRISQLKHVTIDGILYVAIGMFTFLQGYFSTEEAYKYVNPFLLFWLKGSIGSVAAGAAALKMYRSNTFAKHQEDQEEKNNPTNQ